MTTDEQRVAWELRQEGSNFTWSQVKLSGRVRKTLNNPNYEGERLMEVEVVVYGEQSIGYDPESRGCITKLVEIERYWANKLNIKLLPPVTTEIADNAISGGR